MKSNKKIFIERYVDDSKIEVPEKEDTKNIDRKGMPQVAENDLAAFLKYLKNNDIEVKEKTVQASELKASQGQFHKEKIKKIIKSIEANELEYKPLLVSKDNYIVDGHHRWLAFLNLDKKIDIYKININFEDLYKTMEKFPKSFKAKLYECFSLLAEDECKELTKQELKAFEKFINRIYDKFGIDFEFTKHFHDRLSDDRNDPCISIIELRDLFKKIYQKKLKGKNPLTKWKDKDIEIVINDIQSDLNMPVRIEYNKRTKDFDIIAKTIMRKKDFKTRNPFLKI